MSTWAPRSAADYAHALLAKLPLGEVWPRAVGAILHATIMGLGTVVGRWAQRCGRFALSESFPPWSIDMLSDWERVLGLPEPCLPVGTPTIAERQAAVAEKLARRPGRQDPAYFIWLARRLGYTITITEHIPAQCAMTPCGAYRTISPDGTLIVRGAGCGTPYIRFVWRVTVTGPRLTWFALGLGGRAGQDPHLRIRRAEDLECLLDKLKPAHTKLIFAYSGV